MQKVNQNVAVIAYDKGFFFEEPCFCGGANSLGKCQRCDALKRQCEENFSSYIPYQSEVQAVLRGINIHAASEAIPQSGSNQVKFLGHVLFVGNNVMISENTKEIHDTYESALDDALEYALELITVIDEMEEDGEYEDEDDNDENDEDYE